MIATGITTRISVAALAFATVFFAHEAGAHPRGHAGVESTESADLDTTDANTAKLLRLEALLDKDPKDTESAVEFARYAAKRARRLGDTALLRRAVQALSPWRDNGAAPTDILIIRANINQIDHRFDDALADLRVVLEREPTNPQALLSRAFIFATTGKAELGQNDCAALRPSISVAVRETCRARLTSLTGEIGTAYRRMQAVLAIIPATRNDERSFALAVAAEVAERRGDVDGAEKYLSELIAIDSQSVFARAAFAEFLLGQGKPQAAARIIGDDPQTEALLMLRALAGKNLDDPVSQLAAQELRARMAADSINADYSHAREYARFALDYLGDPNAALRYARENWSVQKEPVDARILARAAIAKGDQSIIDALRGWQEETGLEDAALSAFLRRTSDDDEPMKEARARLTQP